MEDASCGALLEDTSGENYAPCSGGVRGAPSRAPRCSGSGSDYRDPGAAAAGGPVRLVGCPPGVSRLAVDDRIVVHAHAVVQHGDVRQRAPDRLTAVTASTSP